MAWAPRWGSWDLGPVLVHVVGCRLDLLNSTAGGPSVVEEPSEGHRRTVRVTLSEEVRRKGHCYSSGHEEVRIEERCCWRGHVGHPASVEGAFDGDQGSLSEDQGTCDRYWETFAEGEVNCVR